MVNGKKHVLKSTQSHEHVMRRRVHDDDAVLALTVSSFCTLHHMAYLRVHSLASSLYFMRSVLYILAISGTRGSSGLGSVRSEQIDNNTFEIVRAGDHCDLKMSKQMLPLLFMLG